MRRRRHVLQVSTFPFLAVLLCTMGSLILLLLVIDRRAKAVARFKAAQAAAESLLANAKPEKVNEDEWAEARRRLHAALEEEIQEVRGQAERTHEQAGTTAAKLTVEQSQIRDLHTRLEGEKVRYTQMLQSLTARKEELAKSGKEDKATEQLRRQLTADLASLEQTLADLQALRKRDQRTFSLVPYKGRRGDTRRPVYVECTAAGWIFHPDLKALTEIGDGMKALRAEFEGRLSASAGAKDSAPYVFLLVRPDGITSYYRALAAMQGLQADFGYEFVDASWILDFSEKPEASQPWMTAGAAPPGSAPSPSAPPAAKNPGGAGLRGATAPAAVTLGPAARLGPNSGASGSGDSSSPGSTGATSGRQGSQVSGLPEFGAGTPGISTGSNGGSSNVGGFPGAPRGTPGNGQRGSGSPSTGARQQTDPSVAAHAGKGVNFSSPNGPAGTASDPSSPFAGGGLGSSSSIASTGTSAGNGGDSALPLSHGGTGTGSTSPPGAVGERGDTSPSPASVGGSDPAPSRAPAKNSSGPPSLHARLGSGIGSEGAASGNASASGAAGSGSTAGSSGSQEGLHGVSGTPASPLGPPAVPYPVGNPGGTTGQTAAQDTGTGAHSATTPGNDSSKTPAKGGSGNGEPAQDAQDDKESGSGIETPPLSRLPKGATPKPKNAGPRPARLTGNRDWIIALECTADAIVLPNGVKVSAQSLSHGDGGAKALVQGVQELINRKQATVRAGEPEYRPQVRFLVHPDGLRLYHLAYPTLEPLQIPILRQNVEPDDPHQPAKGVRRP